ncbi:MAG TPA: SDR family oxidoreductase, partial [Acidimicrobiales bacterium]|nr:SDR family oxidoreductase [Acidimicrobiales bacterium]
NLLTPVQLCRQAIPRMLGRGGGHIVNVSSLAGTAVFPGLVAYSSTKSGLTHFTSGLRADLKGLPIKTTVVELGPIPTDMLSHVDSYRPTEKSFQRFYRTHLIVDIPREKVADAVLDAVRKGQKHVRFPKRAAAFALLAEAPRRTVELLLTGVPHQ